jgi:hypothetical protein
MTNLNRRLVNPKGREASRQVLASLYLYGYAPTRCTVDGTPLTLTGVSATDRLVTRRVMRRALNHSTVVVDVVHPKRVGVIGSVTLDLTAPDVDRAVVARSGSDAFLSDLADTIKSIREMEWL